jgi:hypothetical protein
MARARRRPRHRRPRRRTYPPHVKPFLLEALRAPTAEHGQRASALVEGVWSYPGDAKRRHYVEWIIGELLRAPEASATG